MDSRERLKRCYSHQELDRPAICFWASFPKNDPSYDKLKTYVNEYTDLRPGWNGRRFESEYSYDTYTEPYSKDYERVVTTLHTPNGDLTATSLSGLNNQPGLHESYFIKDEDDIEKYLSLPLPIIAGGDISKFFEMDKKLGNRGIVDIRLGSNPGGFVAELMGSENFAIMTVTNRDLVHELCERQMKVIMNAVKYLLQNNVQPFFSVVGEEYIVPPLHGPCDFYDFNVKYDKPIFDLIHNASGRVRVHSHGSVNKVLQGFIDSGADVLHPFEAPPMGDVIPSEAKSLIRGRLCFEGNIQINTLYENKPESIKETTSNLITDVFDDRKDLIVCATASPYLAGEGDRCFEQYKAMIDTVIHWKL